MVDGGDRAINLGEVAHRHRRSRPGATFGDAFARRLVCAICSLVHGFAAASALSELWLVSLMLDFTYGCHRQ